MQRKLTVPLLAVLAACGGGDKPTPVDPPPKLGCDAGTGLTLGVGEVRALSGDGRSTICVNGGGGGEYALMPIYTGDSIELKRTLTFTAVGTTAITGASIDLAPGAGGLLAGNSGAASFTRNAAFDLRLRADERAMFAAHAAEARAAFDTRRSRVGSGARFSIASSTPVVGSFVTLNANAESACSSPDNRVGRVVAVTNNAVVVADTTNPANGFTDADYQSIGTTFDTLAYAVDTLNFGKPADIDGNGDRAVIFFTKAVNDLTPVNSQSYVGGFFYGRDLYPKTASGGLGGCAGSNYAELFYTLVPDPIRAGNNASSPFTKDRVKQLTVAVLAHEFQHLINLSRRLYVTRTSADEDTWLNEGLSHVAEELVFYRAAGLAPRRNLNLAAIQTSANAVNAFNQFESSNMGRLLTYLPKTESNSPTADNDSLETRGATWELLRYSADRKAGIERDTWYSLVNSSTHGLQNMQNVFGTAAFGGTRPWLRDWAVANFTDDAGFAVSAEYTHPSWNFRNLLPALTKNAPYPITTHSLTPAAPVTVTLVGGAGVSYLRFRVPANARGDITVASATGTTLPAGMDMVLVRTQ